ncbi:hypothetical protein HYD91_03800 [Mycoplasmopsis bovis]|nr:hypothetical protein [Mycoplasmopsis bovis]QQH35750.1 hypothetical protein HYD91_03800 [Mycoplasmopsis bovis]
MRLKHNQRKIQGEMNPGGENQTESDEEPEEKLKKHTVKSNGIYKTLNST